MMINIIIFEKKLDKCTLFILQYIIVTIMIYLANVSNVISLVRSIVIFGKEKNYF